ncbi:MAG TPA: hypothetical protein VJU87_11245, partial [Gemmatimonadaceae bacterium]|nr:hypothetical protein [Gemmatimonadaceae bacterium]
MPTRLAEARVVPFTAAGAATAGAAAAAAAALFLALPAARAGAQAEFNLGPFLTYNTVHGGRPAASGLQTGIFVGPIGLRASGFTALDQPTGGSLDAPRWGGDADLLFIFDLSSRGGGRPGLAPYVFAGAGLSVARDTMSFYEPTRYSGSASSVFGG